MKIGRWRNTPETEARSPKLKAGSRNVEAERPKLKGERLMPECRDWMPEGKAGRSRLEGSRPVYQQDRLEVWKKRIFITGTIARFGLWAGRVLPSDQRLKIEMALINFCEQSLGNLSLQVSKIKATVFKILLMTPAAIFRKKWINQDEYRTMEEYFGDGSRKLEGGKRDPDADA